MFFILIIIIVALVYVYLNKNNDYWKKRNIVYEKRTLSVYLSGECSLSEVYKKIYDKYPNEPYVGFFIGTKPALIIRDLHNVQAVLAGDFQSFNSRGILTNPNDVLADNVLFMDHFPRWKLMRQKLSPVFTKLRLKSMFYILDRCARDFVQMMEDNIKMSEKPFNALYTYSTASIAASVFGIDANINNTMESPFLDMAWKSLNPTLKRNFQFFLANIFPPFITLFNFKAFSDHEEFFVGVMKKVLQERRMNEQKRNDFIDLCVELQSNGVMQDATTGYEIEPTDEILAAQAFFFFIAGADTSANTMHFTLIELASNPHILSKVHEEIDKVFEECNETLTTDEIDKLQYLDQVVNEAMRKYPPIGLMQRKCTKETVLPVGNLKIEKDVLVVVPTYAIHRDEALFHNPEEFDPERFSPENINNIKKYSFIPFGEGNRICIGKRYAYLQVKAGLAWLLRRFTLQPQDYATLKFEKSFFSLRDPSAKYVLKPRHSFEQTK